MSGNKILEKRNVMCVYDFALYLQFQVLEPTKTLNETQDPAVRDVVALAEDQGLDAGVVYRQVRQAHVCDLRTATPQLS